MSTAPLLGQALHDVTRKPAISVLLHDDVEVAESTDTRDRASVVRFADSVDSIDDASSCFSDISDTASDPGDCERRRTNRLYTEDDTSPRSSPPTIYDGISTELNILASEAGVNLAYGLLLERQSTKEEKESTGVERLGAAFGVCCLKGLKTGGWNQDDYFVYDSPDRTYIGVFDGHGSCGHDASAMARYHTILRILKDSKTATPVGEVLRAAFVESDAELLLKQRLFSSGTTASVLCVDHVNHNLVCAHVGDSRIAALPGSQELTQDHRPEDAEELLRIKAAGGEVRTCPGDVSSRIFRAGDNRPGLAMSRSLGDKHGKLVGVCADPTITIHPLTQTRLVICTDGVWEFISTCAASELVAAKTSAQEAAHCLAHEAWGCWLDEENGLVVDDITVVVYDVPAGSRSS
eukprot:GEMP01041615.1.p1 GENE.GEMP01041615.1~~GEMP01041615.1.p1  ORF type:complete len:407 (+),score=76.90 GEMP01041615.1:211-1431(+)